MIADASCKRIAHSSSFHIRALGIRRNELAPDIAAAIVLVAIFQISLVFRKAKVLKSHMSETNPLHFTETGMAIPQELWLKEQARREAADREQKAHNDKITVLFAVFGFLLTMITIGVSIWALKDSAKNAENSLKVQIQGMQLDERPYVRTEFSGFRKERMERYWEELGKTEVVTAPVMHIKLKTFGRTPALMIAVNGTCQATAPSGDPFLGPLLDTQRDGEREITFLFPNDEREVFCHVTFDSIKEPQVFKQVRYQGTVAYSDLSKNTYQTPFCFLIDDPQDLDKSVVTDCGSLTPPQ